MDLELPACERRRRPPECLWLPRPSSTLPVHGVSALAWFPDGRRLVAGTRKGQVAVVDAENGAVGSLTTLGSAQIRQVMVQPGGHLVAVLGERGGAQLWHPDTGAVLGRLPAAWVQTMRSSADGSHLLTFGRTLQSWLLPT
ncbi:MAG: hypothetical protein O3A25_19650, partial [Acidobacteria bacterium]|nr:hypothetical protein [Acidobacteriota bacterium]